MLSIDLTGVTGDSRTCVVLKGGGIVSLEVGSIFSVFCTTVFSRMGGGAAATVTGCVVVVTCVATGVIVYLTIAAGATC